MPLEPATARRVYDRIGRLQDTQSFYERPATAALLAAAEFGSARAVFELGCGTGALAAELLARHLPATATYTGVDVSPRMVELAARRLRRWAPRAVVQLTEGRPPFDRPDGSVDRFVATYVLDLLSDEDITAMLAEAHRLLGPDGRLCLTSLTHGTHRASRVVSSVWGGIAARAPTWTAGCRPLALDGRLPPSQWEIVADHKVAAWLVTSEVLVARPRGPAPPPQP